MSKSNRKHVSDDIKKILGNKCCNCGTDKAIEYHHIVPIVFGGNDISSNMVAICHSCHRAIHYGKPMTLYLNSKNAGRKPKIPYEEACKVYDLYVNGEIGNMKAKQLLNCSARTELSTHSNFKRYKKEHGIKSVRNLIDVKAVVSEHNLKPGMVCGSIEYINGKVVDMHYHDTGMNDVEYVRRGSVGEELERQWEESKRADELAEHNRQMMQTWKNPTTETIETRLRDTRRKIDVQHTPGKFVIRSKREFVITDLD